MTKYEITDKVAKWRDSLGQGDKVRVMAGESEAEWIEAAVSGFFNYPTTKGEGRMAVVEYNNESRGYVKHSLPITNLMPPADWSEGK